MLTLLAYVAQKQMIEVDVATLTVISGLVIPLLVALVVKANASSTVKSLVNAVLVAVGGGVSLLIMNNGAMGLRELLSAIAIAFVVSGSAYQHLWKPLGVADAIRNYFPGGIGRSAIETTGRETALHEPPPDRQIKQR